MIICNVDHLHAGLRPLSQQASSLFLTGGAAFHEVLAALERAEPGEAVAAAERALKSFDEAIASFSQLAELIESDVEYQWIGDETRKIDFNDAARTVYLSPDSAVVRSSNAELVRGNMYRLFVLFAQRIGEFSGKLRGFADRAAGPNVILDDEYRLAHELLRDWGTMIVQGQYISSVCLAAAPVVRA